MQIPNEIILIIATKQKDMNLFGAFDLKPFWKDYYLKDDYVGMKLILGTIGYTMSLWLLLMTIISRISGNLLVAFNVETTFIVKIFESWGANFLVAIIISGLLTLYQLRTHEVFEGFLLKDNFDKMKLEIFQILGATEEEILEADQTEVPVESQLKFALILTIQVLNGFFTGILFSIIYFIPFFVLVFLMIFVLGNFLPESLFLVYLSFLLAWLLVYFYSMRRRIDFKIKPQRSFQHDVYPLKRRDIDILQSEEPPILCDHCRSFIPAESSTCPVCDSPINIDRDD